MRAAILVVRSCRHDLGVEVGVLGLLPGLGLHALRKEQVALAHELQQVHLLGKARCRACRGAGEGAGGGWRSKNKCEVIEPGRLRLGRALLRPERLLLPNGARPGPLSQPKNAPV